MHMWQGHHKDLQRYTQIPKESYIRHRLKYQNLKLYRQAVHANDISIYIELLYIKIRVCTLEHEQ